MKQIIRFLAAILLMTVVSASLAGCNKGKVVLKVYNWGDYIDESVLGEFEQKFNVKVVYDNFATNEDMYVKLKSGGSDYDVAIPSDYMIKRMVREDMLQKIDFANIPNYQYIDEQYKNLGYDPENVYSVPYMWGTVGIIYNTTMVNETVDSWNILWDEKYKSNIFMLDSQRDSIGAALKKLGYSLNTKDMNELEKAKETLIEQKPLVLSYVGDEVKDKMIQGEAALAVVWSGDAVFMIDENPDLAYVIPKEGTNVWYDAMVIPKTGKHKKEAELFINFMCETDIAYRNADYIGYATPHTKVFEMLDTELTGNRTFYPKAEDLVNSEVIEDLTDFIDDYDRIWTEIMAK